MLSYKPQRFRPKSNFRSVITSEEKTKSTTHAKKLHGTNGYNNTAQEQIHTHFKVNAGLNKDSSGSSTASAYVEVGRTKLLVLMRGRRDRHSGDQFGVELSFRGDIVIKNNYTMSSSKSLTESSQSANEKYWTQPIAGCSGKNNGQFSRIHRRGIIPNIKSNNCYSKTFTTTDSDYSSPEASVDLNQPTASTILKIQSALECSLLNENSTTSDGNKSQKKDHNSISDQLSDSNGNGTKTSSIMISSDTQIQDVILLDCIIYDAGDHLCSACTMASSLALVYAGVAVTGLISSVEIANKMTISGIVLNNNNYSGTGPGSDSGSEKLKSKINICMVEMYTKSGSDMLAIENLMQDAKLKILKQHQKMRQSLDKAFIEK